MNAILLGALLHDLGEVGRRAGQPGNHQEIGSSALRSFLPDEMKEAADLALMHHASEKLTTSGSEPLKKIIASDWISSGKSSKEDDSFEIAMPFKSIFDNIGRYKPLKSSFYLPSSLDINQGTIFRKDPIVDAKKAYDDIWNAIKDDLSTIQKIKDPDTYLTTALYLLKKHAWAVPSSSDKNSSDISLYDHSRITCAFAACLRNAKIEDILREVNSEAEGEERFLLVAGDISGIQDFLYTITSKGALKGLRGRSLYLQLLSEATAKFILQKLNYPQANLIYSGGGHFYLLISATDEKNLGSLRNEVEKALLDLHSGDLFLALGWSKLTVKDLYDAGLESKNNFPKKWSEALAAADEAKLRRFSSLGSEGYKEIFGPWGSGGLTPVCDVCKHEGTLHSREKGGWVSWDPSSGEAAFCDLCKMFEVMGERLSKADYILEVYGAKSSDDSHLLCSFEPFGIDYYYCNCEKDPKKGKLRELIKKFGQANSVIYSLSPKDFISEDLVLIASDNHAALGFRLIAKTTPKMCDRILDMSELAKLSLGIPKIGVLRMDVDDLRKIFSEGLGKNAILARVSTLSSMLSIFFDGWIDKICEDPKWSGQIYLIYSGGDDLFLVGSWNVIPEVAIRIRDDFKEFTCSNPNFTLSGGITLADEKYPLYKSAGQAMKALDKAKARERDGHKKDAVTFLGETMSWDEMRISSNIAVSLASWIQQAREGRTLPKSILWNLFSAWDLYRRNREILDQQSLSQKEVERLAEYDRWRWRLIYFLDRAGGRTKPFESDLAQLKNSIIDEKRDGTDSSRYLIEYLGVSARWAELLTREARR